MFEGKRELLPARLAVHRAPARQIVHSCTTASPAALILKELASEFCAGK
jgi:hypothetical protein